MIPDFDGLREVVHFSEGVMSVCYLNQEVEDYPPHWHSDIEIIMPVEKGYGVRIDGRLYEMQEGDMLLIPPGVIHELFAPPEGKRLIIQICYALTSEMSGFYDAVQLFYPCLHMITDAEIPLHLTLQQILRDIEREHQLALPYHGDMLASLCRQYLVMLARHCQDYVKPDSIRRYAKSVDSFLRVCDYIHRHCTEALPIAKLAEVAGYSKSHFLRMFKEFSNISCGEYIQRQRISLARQLLANPERSITEIVTRAGFGSVASFNRVFREQMNCTPTQYRKILRGQNRNI